MQILAEDKVGKIGMYRLIGVTGVIALAVVWTCISAAACRKDFSELVDLATQHYLFDRERGHSDPLYVADELGQLKGAEFSECKACAKSLESWAAKERERLWKLIPTWFRLEVVSEPCSR